MGLQRDSTGLPKSERKSKVAPPEAALADALDPPPVVPASEAMAGTRPPKQTSKAARQRANSASSSCNSSEADLEAHNASSSARACRIRQRKTTRERAQVLIKEAGRRACTDEGEATAPHRLWHVRKRVKWKESLATAPLRCTPAGARSESEPEQPSVEATARRRQGPELEATGRSRPSRLRAGVRTYTAKTTSAAISSLLR